MNGVYTSLVETRARRGGAFFLLLDPDRHARREYVALAEAAEECGVDCILVGSSLLFHVDFHDAVREIKHHTDLPVVIFPGSYAQVCPDADAIVFSSLISSRNPGYLIDEQVRGAPLVKRYGLEPIATGYMLIESGPLTSVQYMSSSLPIPRSKNDIACAHALAAQYLGMKMVYLEAGSGAAQPVPVEMVHEVSTAVNIPVIVGGGLRAPDQCAERIAAGAAFVVMGNCFESEPGFRLLREAAAATHPMESIRV